MKSVTVAVSGASSWGRSTLEAPGAAAIAMEEPEAPWDDDLALVRLGDEAAARRLVERLYPRVIRIIRGHRHRSDDEEDLAQDVFMKMFSKLGQFEGSKPFHHWVARIALNTCYDRLRRHRNRRVVSFSELSLDESEFLERARGGEVPAPGMEGAGDGGASALELLYRLLDSLKPREQKVIRLLDLEERSVREVCEITGWGESKVKVTAHRARRKLSASLRALEKAPRSLSVPLVVPTA